MEEDKKINNMHQRALQYVLVSGYSVIPCGLDKRPLLSSWKEFQTRLPSEAELEHWWTKWPFANIGIVTGKISGITVVDIDTYKTDHTPLEKFPETETVLTGNKGYHLFYEYQEGMSISANAYKDLPGVDIRSDGGFVVAVPSVTSYLKEAKQAGGEYVYFKTVKQAPFPKDMFPKSKVKKTLDDTIGVEVGGRNDAIASVIGSLLKANKMDVWQSEVWPAVEKINKTYQPPLGAKELRTTFLSIAKKEKARRKEEGDTSNFLMSPPNKDGEKSVIKCQENVFRSYHFTEGVKGKFRFNKWLGRRETLHKSPIWRAVEDQDYHDVQSILANSYKHMAMIQAPQAFVQNALVQYCAENVVDPAEDYYRSLVWDKTPRLHEWLHKTFGTENNEYYETVGTQWLKALIKRVFSPGCKFDYVLVLEGKQGIGKSSSLRLLVGDWHVEVTSAPDNKDFFMIFQGHAIVEFSEGETMSRSSMKLLKSVITTQVDTYRAPYEREMKAHPRRCVFAMSINQDEYLRDETGNRRFLPVECEKADLEWLSANKEQLFAEAYHRAITLDEDIYTGLASDDAKEIQEAKRIKRPEEDKIVHWYLSTLDDKDREDGVSVQEVFDAAVKVPSSLYEQMTPLTSSIIAQTLTQILQLKSGRRRGITGRSVKYYPTECARKLWPAEVSVLHMIDAPINKLLKELNAGRTPDL